LIVSARGLRVAVWRWVEWRWTPRRARACAGAGRP
jgi:hypothetical protein